MTLEEALARIKELETQLEVLQHQLGLEQLLNDNLRLELEAIKQLP